MIKGHLTLLIAFAILAVASSQIPTLYTYKTIDNLNLTLQVYVPSKSSFTRYPVFFGVHGGAYVEGSESSGYNQQELLEILSLGYVAISIDYRLSPGVFLADIVQDMQDAYTWVREELPKNVSINPDAIAIFGRSAGGGLSVMGGYMLSPRPKAVISFYPYCTNFTDPYAYNPATTLTEVVIAEANLLRKPIISEYIGGAIDPRNTLFLTSLGQGKAGWVLTTSDPTMPADQILGYLKNYSTVYHIDKDYPPTYLIHGLNDTLVPYAQSVQMATVLNATNVTNVLSLVPGVGHVFDDGIIDPTSQMWQQYIQPIFNFAKSILESDEKVQRDYITN